MSEELNVLLLADGAARCMAHKFARRKALREERAEEIIDHAAPLVWAQRVPHVNEDNRELLASAIALLAVQRAKKVAYDALVLEREALAQWAARRVPSSQFVGDDGAEMDAPPFPVGDLAPPESWLERWSFQDAARVAYNRLVGFTPLPQLSAYHAG